MQEVIFTRRTTADHAIIYTNTPLQVMLDVTTRMVKTTIQYNTMQYNTIQYNTGGTWVQGRGIVILCKYIYFIWKESVQGFFERLFKKKHKVEGQTM